MFEAVLFDLDGTFADTAPDLAAALNRLREDLGLAPVPAAQLRSYTSQGVRGMLKAGLDLHPGDASYAELYQRFLRYYSQDICVSTTVFAGVDEVLSRLEERAAPWGIVTNKAQRFTLPLLDRLGYAKRAACIVSGDSAPRAKPAAQPMRLACSLIAREPASCLYVGDDPRDIEAGRAAGMVTVAVRYGYLGDGVPIESWGADHVVDSAAEITALAECR
ncbi:MAG TPA: HAD-IA family hydrolase [Accumulibacter sp.]|uniref:HAD-IA family hydrolase n=2 Tax=Accumulibacter sp. TaxID=2053492 RepID=UPI002878B2DC|nr:HAD-IA family hydrolase [Accumulibacter sp.]MDS4054818.1 HAD-IA family hydrolase [Accumulibacter sp.]HMV05485.1 HAD-IA family hydrolase [Accumulibacter sp.]HMW64059.1 HAD-IA family hydrolase [Accumulibacter sp.]HMW80898.1 HAD-IA family hydrolase [Accumulibacter sp.]HMX68966.1 HAD-IA family hydrolase [Accumulibacter sp.]